MNFLSGSVSAVGEAGVTVALDAGGMIDVPCAPAHASPGMAVKLGIRPEHIRLAADAGDVRLAVAITEQLGGESYLHGTLPSAEALSVRLQGQTHVARGEAVGLTLAEPSLRHLFDAGTGIAFAPLS
jgi:ABC-type sugar transport system ATPase subunit